MADISMCSDKTCSSAETCYRFRAIPNPYRQAYANFQTGFQGRCDWYVPIDVNSIRLTPFVKEEAS